MAKRFFDSEKFNDPWYRKLTPKYKCAWEYILSTCDIAGIYKLDFGLMSFCVGEGIDEIEFFRNFSERIKKVDFDKILIIKYIDFQYGFNDKYNARASALKIIDKYNNLNYKAETQPSLTDGSIDPLVKVIVKDNIKDKDNTKKDNIILDYNIIYNIYPRCRRNHGKSKAFAKFEKTIKTEEQFEDLKKAALNFAEYHKVKNTDASYISHFSTWANNWKDWLDITAKDAESEQFGLISETEEENGQDNI